MNALEGDIAGAAFDVRNVSSMQSRPSSQLLLGYPEMIPTEPDCGTKMFLYFGFFHKLTYFA